MDWPVAAGDFFLVAAAIGLVMAPVVGVAGGWSHARPVGLSALAAFVMTFGLLAVSWRRIPGGVEAAAAGHAALLVSLLALHQTGRAFRAAVTDPMLAGLAGIVLGISVTVAPFALGPLMTDLPLGAYNSLLLANPLVTVATASGIDFLHLDLIYRLSPLAHRGVALPAWTTACIGYAVFGGALFGASRLRYRSA